MALFQCRVRDEKEAGNPVASLVHSLHLDRNAITLELADWLDADEYASEDDVDDEDDDEDSRDDAGDGKAAAPTLLVSCPALFVLHCFRYTHCTAA